MNYGIPKTILPFGLNNKPDIRFIRPISITCETGSDSSLLKLELCQIEAAYCEKHTLSCF